jgi:hypothetical protein
LWQWLMQTHCLKLSNDGRRFYCSVNNTLPNAPTNNRSFYTVPICPYLFLQPIILKTNCSYTWKQPIKETTNQVVVSDPETLLLSPCRRYSGRRCSPHHNLSGWCRIRCRHPDRWLPSHSSAGTLPSPWQHFMPWRA